jgi:hypothetical protein
MTRRWMLLLALVGTLSVGGAAQALAVPDVSATGRPVVCLGVRAPIDLGQCVSDPIPDLKDTLQLP